MNVLLQLLRDSEVNCDNIKYYKVQYQERDSNQWKTVFAGGTSDVKNITDLQFDTEYLVKLVAVNNLDFTGFSTLYVARTLTSTGVNIPLSKHCHGYFPSFSHSCMHQCWQLGTIHLSMVYSESFYNIMSFMMLFPTNANSLLWCKMCRLNNLKIKQGLWSWQNVLNIIRNC